MLGNLFHDRPEVFCKLEIVEILIKKICHFAYDQDIRKKLAITFALPTVLKVFPTQAICNHSQQILDALCQNLNSSIERLVPSAQNAYRETLELFLEKIGFFDPLKNADENKQILFKRLMPKLFVNLYSPHPTSRKISV